MISSSYWALERFYYQSKHSIVLHKFLPPPLPILVGHLFTNMHTSTTIYLSLCLPRCFTSLQFKKQHFLSDEWSWAESNCWHVSQSAQTEWQAYEKCNVSNGLYRYLEPLWHNLLLRQSSLSFFSLKRTWLFKSVCSWGYECWGRENDFETRALHSHRLHVVTDCHWR